MSSATLPAPARPAEARPTADVVMLSDVRRGAEARVARIEADAHDAARLMALGVCVGRRVQVVRVGDPMIVRVVGARVGLSARLATGVLVAPDRI